MDGYLVDVEVLIDYFFMKNFENVNYNYCKGVIVGDVWNDFFGVIFYFEKGLVKILKNYDLFFGKESGLFIEIFFYLGKVYYCMN